jgi:hypothetical protein
MTPEQKPSATHQELSDPTVELALHANIEGLQVQVRALATAIDHLCRAVETMAYDVPSEVATSLEDARLALGEIW